MTNKLARNKALKILIQNKLYSLTDCNDLQRIIESNQFTIIEYKKHNNSESVSELIKRLRVENETQQNDSFIYINNNLKFVFINTDVPDQDKCALLRHELGHICDPDLKNGNLQNSRIKREEFANEFSCYTKNPGIRLKIYVFLIKKWKLLVAVMALIACLLGVAFITNTLIISPAKPVTGDVSTYVNSDNTYYVTSTGKKYHRKYCIIIKYKNNLTEIKLNDAINDGYNPCLVCNPQKE